MPVACTVPVRMQDIHNFIPVLQLNLIPVNTRMNYKMKINLLQYYAKNLNCLPTCTRYYRYIEHVPGTKLNVELHAMLVSNL